MITLRRANERGHADHGWLDSHHTFSFSGYHDPRHMGFRALRVINEDRVAPGEGFGTHPHADMEIITYVLEGALAHKDSMGTGAVIRPGDVQRMTAGTGVTHSEFNASAEDPVHFLQIWIIPGKKGLKPGYEQKNFDDAGKRGRLRLVASPDGKDGSLTIHQDARLYASRLGSGEEAAYDNVEGRHAWLQVARGNLTLNGQSLQAGDGVAISGSERLALRAPADAAEATEILLFDLG